MTGAHVQQHGDTAILTLDRPPMNAVDHDAVREVARLASALAVDPPRGGVVLTGAGRAFSSGVDTKAFAAYDAEQRGAFVRAITQMTSALLSIPCPLVAAVNGHALGGGFILMLCADVRIVAEGDDIRLGLPEARAGVPFPAGPVAIMRAELTPGLLRALALTSRPAPASELLAAGAIDRIVDATTLIGAAIETAQALSAQPAFKPVKQQVRGTLIAEVQRLAANGEEPFLPAFL